MKILAIFLLAGFIAGSCYLVFANNENIPVTISDTLSRKNIPDSLPKIKQQPIAIKPVTIYLPKRDSIIAFAKTLIGTPYLYASKDPAKGFDCSGFINYVFNHFNIIVPRSSYDFINVGKKIALDSCQKGDLILFTGTAPQETAIGHIGIICEAKGKASVFIHSSSGKANGVTITSMESTYYQNRFVTVVDILSK